MSNSQCCDHVLIAAAAGDVGAVAAVETVADDVDPRKVESGQSMMPSTC